MQSASSLYSNCSLIEAGCQFVYPSDFSRPVMQDGASEASAVLGNNQGCTKVYDPQGFDPYHKAALVRHCYKFGGILFKVGCSRFLRIRLQFT
jgi:hypothetical protein